MWRVGVVGSPIAHSRSPQLHLLGMSVLNLSGTSTRWELGADLCGDFVRQMTPRFDALSVTMPLKAALARQCAVLDDAARALGVVNSVRLRGGVLEGIATDGPGLLDALVGQWSLDVAGMHVVVLGSGGSALAIVDALVVADVASVVVLGRNPDTVATLSARYDNVTGENAVYRQIDLLINTIPEPSRTSQADTLAGVRATTHVVDITYEPLESGWLAQHRALGCPSMNGLAMLAYQAARQMQWWWDAPIDGAFLLRGLS